MNLHALRSAATSFVCHQRLLAYRPLITSSFLRSASPDCAPNEAGSSFHAFVDLDPALPRLRFHSSSFSAAKPLTWQDDVCTQSGESDSADERESSPNKVQKIVDDISSLNLVEVSELTVLLRKRFGLHHMQAFPMGVGILPGNLMIGSCSYQHDPPVKSESKKLFNVKVEKYAAGCKGKVVKEIRVLRALGLRETRVLLSKTPALVKQGVSKEEAENIIQKLKAVGASAFME